MTEFKKYPKSKSELLLIITIVLFIIILIVDILFLANLNNINLRINENRKNLYANKPEIEEIIASPIVVNPGEVVDLSVEYISEDEVEINWSIPAGEIKDYNSQKTQWISPDDPGEYWISVEITDKYGQSDSMVIKIEVGLIDSKGDTKEDYYEEKTNAEEENNSLSSYPEELKSFRTSIYLMNSDGSNIHELTKGYNPIWSPDGKYITFEGKYDSLWIMNVISKEYIKVSENSWIYSWSPDSKNLLIINEPDGALFIYNIVTNKIQRIFDDPERKNGKDVDNAFFSPDGKKVLVDTKWTSKIYVMNPDGTNSVIIWPDSAYNVSWAPDSKKVLINDFDGFFLIDSDGQNLMKIAERHEANDAIWSPDGSKILMCDGTTSISYKVVFTIDPNSSGRQVVLDNKGSYGTTYNYGIFWSPNGEKILFFDMYKDKWCLINSDGSDLLEILNIDYQDPVWSPDSTKIIFKGEDRYLYVFHLDTKEIIKFENTKGFRRYSWSPDGSIIICCD